MTLSNDEQHWNDLFLLKQDLNKDEWLPFTDDLKKIGKMIRRLNRDRAEELK